MEMDPKDEGSVTENQLLFLAEMANMSMSVPWQDLLNVNAQFFKALELNTMSWDNWKLIQAWLEKAVSALKSKMSAILPQ